MFISYLCMIEHHLPSHLDVFAKLTAVLKDPRSSRAVAGLLFTSDLSIQSATCLLSSSLPQFPDGLCTDRIADGLMAFDAKLLVDKFCADPVL